MEFESRDIILETATRRNTVVNKPDFPENLSGFSEPFRLDQMMKFEMLQFGLTHTEILDK